MATFYVFNSTNEDNRTFKFAAITIGEAYNGSVLQLRLNEDFDLRQIIPDEVTSLESYGYLNLYASSSFPYDPEDYKTMVFIIFHGAAFIKIVVAILYCFAKRAQEK